MSDDNKLIFAIPEHDSDFLARIIEAVPDDWSDMSGVLEATNSMIAEGNIVRDTGYSFRRFDNHVQFSARQSHPHRNDIYPDLVAILIEGKLPSFISFEDTGYSNERKFVQAKRLAAGYVRKGYRGWVTFNNGKNREYAQEQPARLALHLSDWEHLGEIGKPRKPMPPTAVLEWNPRYHGKVEQLDAILRVCQIITFN